ncbi:MaoC family dehydratase [Stappia sp.]|uniref:MaoC family dehydratase n=1 Tax=Stappia sp. TaxID=1870903 RepID=UPI003A99CFA4
MRETTDEDYGRIGTGFFFEDLSVGMRFRTAGRTLTQADLSAFCNLTWLTEELFTNAAHRAEMALPDQVVPGALVYGFAEGLLLPMMQDTGLAFLEADVKVKGPTVVGDTITVYCEVVEARLTSKGGRGLVRTFNSVRRADGTELLTYNPLRMIKARSAG